MASIDLAACVAIAIGAVCINGDAKAQSARSAPTSYPLLWEIGGLKKSYLYGTIHVADERVLNLPQSVRDAISELHRRKLVAPIKDAIDAGKPFLGICLGLQMLFDVSYEDGTYEGLGILPGEVTKFEVLPDYKVPHMGWNQAKIRKRAPILDGIDEGTHFYFVHSYCAKPQDSEVTAIEADYPHPFCAAVWRDNLFATQFHPEKSQASGLKLLSNFANFGIG